MRSRQVASLDLRTAASRILKAALRAVEAGRLIRANVRRQGGTLLIQRRKFDLNAHEKIYLLAFGKAASAMAAALGKILGSKLTSGIATCLPGQQYRQSHRGRSAAASISLPREIVCLPAAHPLPDERSVRAAKEILSLARRAGRRDLVFVLISGGGSAQLCLPREPVTLADKAWVTAALLRAGADIRELNTVRKHLSAIKGGRLAEAAFPASIINLVVSDVVGNDLGTIASGPTHWDTSTYEDARHVLEKFGLWSKAPRSVRSVINAGLRGGAPETLRRGSRVFRRVATFIVGENRTALRAAAERAGGLGFRPVILTSSDKGEARNAARKYAARIAEKMRSLKTQRKPLCFLAGGELTVEVKGRGKGGRNSEFVLAALAEMMSRRRAWDPFFGACRGWDWIVASLGTDGRDGPTDAAGALATPATAARAQALGLDPRAYLDRNDSYNFFRRAGGLIITGPTGTNVMDVRLVLLRPDRTILITEKEMPSPQVENLP